MEDKTEHDAERWEEHRRFGPRTSWLLVLALCAAIWGWGLLNWRLVSDRPRDWDFGALPDVPAQSQYSAAATPKGPATQPQVQPLPEATPVAPIGGDK